MEKEKEEGQIYETFAGILGFRQAVRMDLEADVTKDHKDMAGSRNKARREGAKKQTSFGQITRCFFECAVCC